MKNIVITTEFITLQQFLKFSGACGTGGEAKNAVQAGGVLVNGGVCAVRGKKLRSGDTVSINGETYTVTQ